MEDQEFIRRFEDSTLPKENFHHREQSAPFGCICAAIRRSKRSASSHGLEVFR